MPEMQFGRAGPPPAIIAEQMRQMAAQQEARRAAGPMLYQMYGQQPQVAPQPPMVPPGGIAPPPAGSPQGGPMPPQPGANPAAMPPQGGMPPPPVQPMGGPPTGPAAGMQPPPQPAAPPAQIQPFRPLHSPQPQMGGSIAPPPATAPDQPAPPPDTGKQFDLKSLVQGLKSSGVPPDKVMDMIDQLTPVMNAQNKQELQMMQVQNKAMEAGIHAYRAIIDAERRSREVDIKDRAETRRNEQGDRRLDIMQRRAEQVAGGAGNLKGKIELIYPKGPDGKVDQTKPPIGTRATTKSGKIVYLDEDGLQTTAAALAGGTAAEDKSSKVSVSNVVRQNLVRAGVRNALARLQDIETKYPALNTSAFFGTHGDNPATRAVYGTGRGMMSSQQKQADAAWGSFIDEAIPVFTGGLRGSDAFRRFLIEQAPGVGDDTASRAEKVRLLKANIEGTSHAFFDHFASDPTMWPPGTKPEDVEEAKSAIAKPAAPRAPAAAPKAPAAKGGWKVEKVTP